MFILLLLSRGPRLRFIFIKAIHQLFIARINIARSALTAPARWSFISRREIDNNFGFSRVCFSSVCWMIPANTRYFYVFIFLAVSSKVIKGKELYRNWNSCLFRAARRMKLFCLCQASSNLSVSNFCFDMFEIFEILCRISI